MSRSFVPSGIIVGVLCGIALFLPAVAGAAINPANPSEYLLVTDIPFIGNDDVVNIATYLKAVFNFGIGIAITLAIVVLVIKGIKYMVTDVIGDKAKTRQEMLDVGIGLAIIFGAVIILTTINPELVELNLQETIDATVQKILDDRPDRPAGGGGGTGGCADCVGMPLDVTCKNPASCGISSSLSQNLQALANNLGNENWQVTEGWPPTVTHSDSCHRAGTCFDANFTTPGVPSAERVGNFIDAASRAGLGACYEVCTQSRADELRAAGIPANNLLVLSCSGPNPQITGPHFSVYSHKPSCVR